eukprot:TRINITY_DN80263_c0_g1_i1.p1 TRINITY_DN80263_c0_g1~~TRINITY_DN80263_c0_g1_i1.p1  ORF type:complete len:629 (-),score=126.58 TRINITY_DN80263_c0_g1_i1:49-1935(-)
MAAAAADDEPPYKVAFQGERGAYSEKAVFELLGREQVEAVPYPSFDAAFCAATNGEVDLAMVPIENSLGGTIHANCDLQLSHNLFIIAEHDLRVSHCLMALPGTKMEDITKVTSHPQALAQCDSYLRARKLATEVGYDTAGSAKLIAEGKLKGVAAICSELAAEHYGLEILDKGIEDDANNYTRFLLLRTDPVRVPPGLPCKTSIVFSLENIAGALFKALSVFSLRDIDLAKIESRPCKPDIMDKLQRQFLSMGGGSVSSSLQLRQSGDTSLDASAKRRRLNGAQGSASYRYLFYLDFLAPLDEPNSANAISHLKEIATFLRVLGTYPRRGTLVGLENLGTRVVAPLGTLGVRKKRVGIVGFGNFGQFIAKKLNTDYDVFATSRSDCSLAAAQLGVGWCKTIEQILEQRLDILIVAASVLSFEAVMRKISKHLKEDHDLLVVDVLSVKVHAKTTMLALLPDNCDILCTHPMFGPESGKHGWGGLPFVFERVRLRDAPRCEAFLKWWRDQGCRMVDMTCELHDECAAGSQFLTHFTGRVLARIGVRTTPINTKGFESLLQLVETTCKDSFDLFYALYQCNPNSAQQLEAFKTALGEVSQQLQKSLPDRATSFGSSAPSGSASAGATSRS